MKPENFGYVMKDDFESYSPDDHRLWMQLFYLAEKHVGRDLCDRLQYFRNSGCRLVISKEYGYVIRPIIAPYAWASQKQYDKERVYLNEYKEKLVWLLRKLSTEKIGWF